MSLTSNPFAILGLPERPDLDDETVRAAWRAIAKATHPDRQDGGDLARYTQATAAYHELQTPWGRSEAYADLQDQAWASGLRDTYPDYFPGPGADPDETPEIVIILPPAVLARPPPRRAGPDPRPHHPRPAAADAHPRRHRRRAVPRRARADPRHPVRRRRRGPADHRVSW